MSLNTEYLIIGGGLSGLSLAKHFEAEGADWQILEARDRWGGRVLTEEIDKQGYDLGPSWFWLGQSRIDALINEFDLNRFEQAYNGDMMFHDSDGSVHQTRGMASMQGSMRLEGGLGKLIAKLVEHLPDERLALNSAVVSIVHLGVDEQNAFSIQVETHAGIQYNAKHVILALPPRVAAHLNFSPALPELSLRAARSIPTWMAGHAKVVATYSTPFWLENGLSGEALSQCGPLAEIHDASPANGGPYALFGFALTPATIRAQDEQVFEQAIRAQLVALFGAAAGNPLNLIIKDWANDKFTATQLVHQPVAEHPNYSRPKDLVGLFDGCLHFGSSEMAAQYGGYLEGALEASEELYRSFNQ